MKHKKAFRYLNRTRSYYHASGVKDTDVIGSFVNPGMVLKRCEDT